MMEHNGWTPGNMAAYVTVALNGHATYILHKCPHWGHVRWVPCQHNMAHPQVADKGDALQIWRVATNILNKQLWTADKAWSSSLGLTTPHRKK
jgi:hypothetical protein